MAAKKSNLPLLLATATALGGGYYYYTSSGGNVKSAQSQFEHDTAKARDSATETFNHLKASATSASELSKQKFEEATAKIDAERKKAQAEVQQKIDEADKKIQEGAKKAGGWFGRG
ncbi:hypothetical protein TWF106_009586 [Orbilia oligospora]|uniref:Uncharacterized protein n=1 Tax=Orbilia oligospora TaxID=2813651 RepID=A0A7C8QID0_ORBOL|nr:hypothetical protein TWF788_004533 [Orbilia oligospora]KAF3213298.1 hypothetical protein TWF106_009586 [Orbilia oligospora]